MKTKINSLEQALALIDRFENGKDVRLVPGLTSNGLGIKAVQLVEGRGALVGALVVSEDDQVMAIMKSGKVIRSNVDEVKRTGRNTQGVTFAKPDKGDTILSIARNEEKDEPEDGGDAAANGTAETAQSGENVNNADEA